jgi:hypothetical protein
MTAADPVAAGRLIAYALQPKLVPARDADYAALVAQFHSEPAFAELVAGVAEGQGVLVLACDRLLGLIVAPTAESPHRLRMDDYLTTVKVEQRLLHGLAHLAIAAVCYPTAASLEDDAAPLPSVSAREVHERVERLAAALHERFHRADPPTDEPELEPVWRLVIRTRAVDTTTDGRSTTFTTLGMIKRALAFLADHGLADEVPRAAEPDTYRMRARYRLHVLDAARQALVVARDVLGTAVPTIETPMQRTEST